ncbi:glycoside hydrolase family 3 protein [Brevibacillus daliensis]|uniref:glycoside hydrolase family 3 protein n=1 Tax=Brevibacillus daliensis TaxID=2892995 RepID=UPI001E60DB10|nr:glycoside hydrolase family 3 protein [Brevibacillus daliensis]
MKRTFIAIFIVLLSGILLAIYLNRPVLPPTKAVSKNTTSSLSTTSPTVQTHDNKEEQLSIAQIVSEMSVEEKVGQTLMPSFAGFREGEYFQKLTPQIKEQLQKNHIGGVILFRDSMHDVSDIVTLTSDIQQASTTYGMLIGIDQEGGTVSRMEMGTQMPGNMALGAANDLVLTKEVAGVIAEELKSLGIQINFAPAIDVNNNHDNPVIGVRSFGEDPQVVSKQGVSYLKGIQENGVAVSAKHFPGHGDTSVDSHVGLPVVKHDRKRLERVELAPFQAAVEAGVDSVMVAHISFPAIDDSKVKSSKSGQSVLLPATLSPKIMQGILREEMGFDGVIITDAMNMAAVTKHFDSADASIQAFNAGADIILMPPDLDRVHQKMVEAVQSGKISTQKLDESVTRILTLKQKRGVLMKLKQEDVQGKIQHAKATVGSEPHLKIEQRAAEASITLITNKNNVLPLQIENKQSIAVIGPSYTSELANELGKYGLPVKEIPLSLVVPPTQQKDIQKADVLVFITQSWSNEPKKLAQLKSLMNPALANGKQKVIVVSVQNPYDLGNFPNATALIAQYGYTPASFKATATMIMGKIKPMGKLPVTIYNSENQILFPALSGLTW